MISLEEHCQVALQTFEFQRHYQTYRFQREKGGKKLIFFYPAKLSCLGKRQWKDSLRYGKVQKASLPCAFLEDCFEDTSQALM